MDTKTASDALEAYKAAIGSVPGKYQKGIDKASGVIEKSKAAEDTYAAGVADAVARKARLKGLEKVSDADWKEAAKSKGGARIGQGMTAGTGKFASGISEVIGVLQGISLPNRTIDPEANVDARVKPIVRALHDHFKR
jgi:hypothetical protein